MRFLEITKNKKAHLDLLLLADEDERMIDRYLDRGRMFALDDGGIKTVCVVTNEGNGLLEIKNLATLPDYQGQGYGHAMIEFIVDSFKGEFSQVQVGTGDSPLTVPFYEKCGFVRSHIIPGFFTENYDHPIFEGGVQLTDMLYLIRKI